MDSFILCAECRLSRTSLAADKETLLEALRVQADTIARLGGDEFTVVLEGLRGGQDSADVAQKILSSLREPLMLHDRDLVVTASIGISVFPDAGMTTEELLRSAYAAMYRAKREGRNAFTHYSAQMTASAIARLSLESDLHGALELERLSGIMRSIRDLGIAIAIDDFGRGDSSLSYLRHYALTRLNIDASFVRDLANDADVLVLVRTIIALGRSLGLDIIAEGVETPDQQSILAREGCQLGQGYLFSRPLHTDALFDLSQRLQCEGLRAQAV